MPREATLPRRLAKLSDAAAYSACSTKTVRRWIASGKITGYRAGSRMIRVDLNQIDAILQPIPTLDGSQTHV